MECDKCDARCCRYFCFEIDKPETYEDFENIRWYLLHEKTSIHIDCDGDWCIMIENTCRNLKVTAKGHRCTDYGNRPLICRKYSTETCDRVKGGYDFEELFETADQLDQYARRMLGEVAYESAKVKYRKKAERIGEGKRKRTKAPPPILKI